MNIQNTIDAFNSLVIINNDRIEGYKKANKETNDDKLKVLFLELLNTSVICKNELVSEIILLKGEPDNCTNITGKFFRIWMGIKSTLTRNDRKAILDSCIFGEDAALKTYKNVLIQDYHDTNSREQKMLNDHYALLKLDYDKLKNMQDLISNRNN